MSWLTDLVRPRISTAKKREVSRNVWSKCPGCGTLIYEEDLAPSLYVCTTCNHHLRWPLTARLAHLWDENSAQTISFAMPSDDPLTFKDRKKYKDRLKEARASTGRPDAFITQHGTVHNHPCAMVALDFDFQAGSMSRAVGEAIVQATQYATANGLPLLCITASGGARMQESILSLMQMARTTAALQNHADAGLPFIVLLTDPTTGGVTASFAMRGDITLAEPGALIGFAGPRVIQQTIGQTLPEGFQRSEYLYDHGMVDQVVSRKDQREVLRKILDVLSFKKDEPKAVTKAQRQN